MSTTPNYWSCPNGEPHIWVYSRPDRTRPGVYHCLRCGMRVPKNELKANTEVR